MLIVKKILRKFLTPYMWGFSSTEMQCSQLYFSQFGEDICIQFLLKLKTGFYVDVGAFHPMHLSNTFRLYKNGWRGIVIDPNPIVASLFTKYRPQDIAVTCGISDCSTTSDFMLYDKPAFNCLREFDTAVPEDLKQTAECISVQVCRLEEVLRKHHVKTVDYLNIDCEGNDLKVLQSNDWNIWRPQVVTVEDHSLCWQDSEIVDFMASKRYILKGRMVFTSVFALEEK